MTVEAAAPQTAHYPSDFRHPRAPDLQTVYVANTTPIPAAAAATETGVPVSSESAPDMPGRSTLTMAELQRLRPRAVGAMVCRQANISASELTNNRVPAVRAGIVL